MAIRTASTSRMNYHDDALHVLQCLAQREQGSENIVFSFDVPLHRCTVVCPGGVEDDATGNLSLAVYNELKLSQYIVEDDHCTNRERRRFWLTARGRLVASAVD